MGPSFLLLRRSGLVAQTISHGLSGNEHWWMSWWMMPRLDAMPRGNLMTCNRSGALQAKIPYVKRNDNQSGSVGKLSIESFKVIRQVEYLRYQGRAEDSIFDSVFPGQQTLADGYDHSVRHPKSTSQTPNHWHNNLNVFDVASSTRFRINATMNTML